MFVPDSDNRMAGQGESCRSSSGIPTQCSCVVMRTAVANTTFPGDCRLRQTALFAKQDVIVLGVSNHGQKEVTARIRFGDDFPTKLDHRIHRRGSRAVCGHADREAPMQAPR
jgi:hypothetical protein